MPKVKKISGWQELVLLAWENYGQSVQDALESADWDTLRLDTRMSLADFAAKRILGMDEEKRQIEHEIRCSSLRKEYIEDPERKKVAEVVLQKYLECYQRAVKMDLREKVFEEGKKLLDDGKCVMGNTQSAEFRRRADSSREGYMEQMEKLRSYRRYMASFFADNVVFDLDPVQEPEAYVAEWQMLQEIKSALPQEGRYDIYRSRDGYESRRAVKINPSSATLVMNPNVIADVTADNYSESIHRENPSRASLEWGAATFDNMMESLYNADQWAAVKMDRINLLGSVFLNGKPATDMFPARGEEETSEEYQKRIKSEIVAYALEGRGSIHVSPCRKERGEYIFKDPIPVKTKVNLEEKVSYWNRFLRFFRIKKVETKKEKSERVSLETLNRRDHLDEAKRNVDRLVERENIRQMAIGVDELSEMCIHQGDRDFFGFLVSDENYPDVSDEISKAVIALSEAEVSRETGKKMGMEGKIKLLETMGREHTRVDMVRLFAMTKGMSLKEVLSSDPALRDRKREIGREFMDMISLKSEEEFLKETEGKGDYVVYYSQKARPVYDMLKAQHLALGNIPYDFFKRTDPKDLLERYGEYRFAGSVSQDLRQSCSEGVKRLNFDEMEALEGRTRAIGELAPVASYCREYLTSEVFAERDMEKSETVSRLISGVVNRVRTERLIAETKGIAVLGDLNTVATEQWFVQNSGLYPKLIMTKSNPKGAEEMFDYMECGGKPVHYYDEKQGEFVVDSPEAVDRALRARSSEIGKNREAASLNEFEEKEVGEISRPVNRVAETSKKQNRRLQYRRRPDVR